MQIERFVQYLFAEWNADLNGNHHQIEVCPNVTVSEFILA